MAQSQRSVFDQATFSDSSDEKNTIAGLSPEDIARPDPDLALSEGKAGTSGTVLVALAIIFIVTVVLYGIAAPAGT